MREKTKEAWFTFIIFMVVLIAALFGFGLRGSCVDDSQALRAVNTLGFTNAHVVDKSIWFVGFQGCDARDAALFAVQATNPVGKRVIVNVCVGWPFKGATVRGPQ
jgi:hypothetical protein